MTSDRVLGFTMVVYLLSFLIYMVFVAFKDSPRGKKFGLAATVMSSFGFLIHTGAFCLRWYESYELNIGHIPLTNMYESMVFFTWSIMLIYLILEFRYGHRSIGVVATLLAALGLALTSLFNLPRQISPLVPALQSNWLTAHVITCFLGYGAFAIGFGVSLLLLVRHVFERKKIKSNLLPSGYLLDELNYKSIAIGFPMLTIGIFTGAVWADYAWGTYWSWDPKETWSLITWFVYALFLHFRLTKGWRGVKSAIISIIGFIFVIFTYWGVNYLLSGLHSYA